jgi:hypothetical protein
MDKELSVALEDKEFNMTETHDGQGLCYIRWGFVKGSDGEMKALAFYAGMLEAQAAHMSGKDITVESNNIAAQDSTLSGPKHQAFEWLHTEFVPVNAETQTWFRFT